MTIDPVPDVQKVACWVPISRSMAAEIAHSRGLVDEMFDRWANPWKYPDGNPLPVFDLFPVLSRLAAWVRSTGRSDEDYDTDW